MTSDGVESFLKDIGNILLDKDTCDVVLLCEGEEFKAHQLILTARSQVFRAMLKSNTLETANGEIRIQDAEKDVLQEMLRYLYKIEVDVDFTKFEKLLVLADKYQILDLVKYCEEKIIKSLNDENALEMAIFAETHNADNLLHESVKFILDNVPNCLKENLEELMKGSPKMMIKVFHNLLDNFSSSEICEIKRKGKVAPPSWTNDGYTNAIAFQVDAKVKLHGVAMYGSRDDNHLYDVKFKIHKTNLDGGSECIYEETKQYKSNGSETPIKITFSKPIEVDANIKYHLIAEGITGDTFFGKNSKKIVSSNDSNPFKVTFFESDHHIFNKSESLGQFPTLYFSRCKN